MRISDWSSDVCSSDLAIAQQYPVDRDSIGFRPAFARFPDELGIEAERPHLEILGIDLPDQVEIDKTVVHRRHQRIRPRRHIFGEFVIASRRIDNKEVKPGSQCVRSEEHTSELQSLMRISYAVFCLKKKTYTHRHQHTTIHNHIHKC